MLTRSSDPHLVLLSYRETPLPWCDLRPSQLCMGRRVRTLNFDRAHRVKAQPLIPDNTDVWVTSNSNQVV